MDPSGQRFDPFGMRGAHGAWGDAFAGPSWTSWPRLWLVATTAWMLAFAAGFGVVAILEREARVGFGITAAVFLAPAVPLAFATVLAFRRTGEVRRARAGGLQGTARILGFTQTGIELNDQPFVRLDLEVRAEGLAPYRATANDYVPLTMVGRLTDGRPLPVHIDPGDQAKVFVDWSS